MVWKDRNLSELCHNQSTTFVRDELSVITPCPVTAFYETAVSVYTEEEALCDKENKGKRKKYKTKNSKRSSSEHQSPSSERKERRRSRLESKGEHRECHERRNQEEMRNAKLKREHTERRERRKQSNASHRHRGPRSSSDRSNKACDDGHLDGYSIPCELSHILDILLEEPRGVTSFAQAQSVSYRRPDENLPKTTEVDCDLLLIPFLHAQRKTASPSVNPLIATSNHDFQETFGVLARTFDDNFERSLNEFSQHYFDLSPWDEEGSMNGDEDFLQIPFTIVLQKGPYQ
jgi:hypothetical protein